MLQTSLKLLASYIIICCLVALACAQLPTTHAGPGALGGGGGPTTTWDPATKGSDISLSGSNLVATQIGISNTFVTTTSSHNSGKWYFELTWQGPNIANTSTWIVFMQRANHSGLTGVVQAQNAGGGAWQVNGSSTGTQSTQLTPPGPDFVAVAIDFTNSLSWVRSVTNPLWNNTSGDPALGTNGNNFSAAVDGTPFFAGAILQNIAATDNVTLNVGGSAYHFTPPAGFGNW